GHALSLVPLSSASLHNDLLRPRTLHHTHSGYRGAGRTLLPKNEAFSVKMASKRDNRRKCQGATERASHLPSMALERGTTPVGRPHPSHLSLWPAPPSHLIFCPFLPNISIFFVSMSSSDRKAPHALPHWYADL